MRIFNLAEELEKERKKNKELEEKLEKEKQYKKFYENMYLASEDTNKQFRKMSKHLINRIDKAIEYFNELEKENNKIIKFEVQHDEYQHIAAEAENTLIDNAKKILKGE